MPPYPNRAILLLLFMVTAACGVQAPTPTTQPTPTISPTLPPTSTPTTVSTATSSPPTDRNRPLLMAHYMPWYQTQAQSGYWGWHWTMDHFDPTLDADGRYQIASHYHPLIGPYDSRDEAVLEYHILLMRLSGIDGVLVDWYGIEHFWDYGLIQAATTKLFRAIQDAGLLFAIVYEDQTVGHMVDNHHLEPDQALTHGQEVMRYLQENWFTQPAYLKVGTRPVLLTFGPQFYKEASDWQTLFSVLETRPLFITLDDHGEAFADASYPWPPMWASTEGVLATAALTNYLTNFYQKADKWEYLVAGAFPGFHDIYEEAGVGPSYGYLDAREGETFALTLETALRHDPDVIQLITWNDYGEGTIIEPTVEFEYRYLIMLQDLQRDRIDPDFAFTAADLNLPGQLFRLRQLHEGDAVVNGRLDEAAQAILTGDLSQAQAIIADYPLQP